MKNGCDSDNYKSEYQKLFNGKLTVPESRNNELIDSFIQRRAQKK